MMNDVNSGGGDGRRACGAVQATAPGGMIFYRVVEDFFGDSEGVDRPIEVVIQTTDPADFAELGEAVEEAMDRIQERIDLEEMAGEPDGAHLDLLQEKLGDTGEGLGADWEAYCSAISQPTVLVDREVINLAEVEGRGRFARLVRLGCSFSERQVETFEKLSRQAEVGSAAPRIKSKARKPRPRPELDLSRVKIDPTLAAAYPKELILGFLAKHRQLFESSPDWKPHRIGFVSDLGRPETSASYIHILTVFLDEATCVTFAVAAQMGQLPPPDAAVMDQATIWLDPILRPESN